MQPGAPLCITLAEAGVTTTCELTTYEPDDWEDEGDADIPLQRDAIVFKTIMRSTWLHNAITELDATNPTILTFNASATEAPYFVLSCSGGPFSDSAVEFSVENDNAVRDERRRRKDARAAPAVSETFQVRPPEGATLVRQSYKFSLVRKALDAMAASSKVSIRCDEQGVMSLQFMIELGKSMHGKPDSGAVSSKISSAVSFVDFRFVPIIDDSDEEQSYADEP
ncbi:ssDNA endodeoxyribonuclease [Ascosphaera atra]|nr:ssDNA endodeoxyribonuclease [Ascosphaera atra]